MPLTKRIQNKAKAEGCVHAEQVRAWEAKTKTEPKGSAFRTLKTEQRQVKREDRKVVLMIKTAILL